MIQLVGAGGHGRVVYDALIACGIPADDICVSDRREGRTMLGLTVFCPELSAPGGAEHVHVAVGGASEREQLYARAERMGMEPRTVTHPAGRVSSFARIGPGAFVAAGAVVAAHASIGRGSIVNHCAVVDHDVAVGDFSHVAPGATIGGDVTIGSHVLVGAGAVILPGVTIGDEVTIGAGAVVLADLPANSRWVGNPARRLDER